MTDDKITIGVIADLTGVVPGLFKAAPDAVKAYAAMVNEAGGIHGRELVVEVFDTGTNDNGNRLAYEEGLRRGLRLGRVGVRLRHRRRRGGDRVRVPPPRRLHHRRRHR